ncbi:MAG: hypothetical protein Fues2KO_52670 [Fuerstiella sp.]
MCRKLRVRWQPVPINSNAMQAAVMSRAITGKLLGKVVFNEPDGYRPEAGRLSLSTVET